MKRRMAVALAAVLLVCLAGCSKPKDAAVADMAARLEGVWIDLDSCERLEDYEGPDIMFQFYQFANGEMTAGAYPGGYSQPRKLVAVDETATDTYVLTFLYPAGEYEGEYYEEERIECTVTLKENKLVFAEEPSVTWTYICAAFDDIHAELKERM